MLCGVIDLGSNTIRLSIYKIENKNFTFLVNEKSFTGLISYVENEIMSEKGIHKACKILSKYKRLAECFSIDDLYVFATASLRNITNRDEVIHAIELETSLRLDVLSGEDEAILGYNGASRIVNFDTGLFIDIGGGSTELLYFEGGKVINCVSIPIGCLNLYHNHTKGYQPDKKERKAIKRAIEDALNGIEWLDSVKPTTICGVGGTIRASKRLYAELTGECNCIEFDTAYIKHILKSIISGENENCKTFLKIIPERMHTIVPGLLILREIIKRAGAKKLFISKYGVREGYLISRVLTGERFCEQAEKYS